MLPIVDMYPRFEKYTFVASTASPLSEYWLDTRVVMLPPPFGSLLTEPVPKKPWIVQYTFALSMTRYCGLAWDVANGVAVPPEIGAFMTEPVLLRISP